jgi:hypothetical protein
VQQPWLHGSCGGLRDSCEQFRAWPPYRDAPREDSVLRGLLRHRPKQLQSAAYSAGVSSRSERFYCVKSVGLFVSRASQRIWCSPYSQGVEKGDKLSPDRRVSTEQNYYTYSCLHLPGVASNAPSTLTAYAAPSTVSEFEAFVVGRFNSALNTLFGRLLPVSSS